MMETMRKSLQPDTSAVAIDRDPSHHFVTHRYIAMVAAAMIATLSHSASSSAIPQIEF